MLPKQAFSLLALAQAAWVLTMVLTASKPSTMPMPYLSKPKKDVAGMIGWRPPFGEKTVTTINGRLSHYY